MNADVRRVLQETRRHLLEHGWCPAPSSALFLGRCWPACVGLAIVDYAGSGKGLLQLEAAKALGFDTLGELYEWNDAQRSVEPVIALLDKVLAEDSGREPKAGDRPLTPVGSVSAALPQAAAVPARAKQAVA